MATTFTHGCPIQVKFARRKMLSSVHVPGVDGDDAEIDGPNDKFSVNGYVWVSARQGMSFIPSF
jgi:hypothetical protein